MSYFVVILITTTISCQKNFKLLHSNICQFLKLQRELFQINVRRFVAKRFFDNYSTFLSFAIKQISHSHSNIINYIFLFTKNVKITITLYVPHVSRKFLTSQAIVQRKVYILNILIR